MSVSQTQAFALFVGLDRARLIPEDGYDQDQHLGVQCNQLDASIVTMSGQVQKNHYNRRACIIGCVDYPQAGDSLARIAPVEISAHDR